MTYFGTNIKKIRQIKGLSQQAFAELLNLNRGVISSYEEGRAEPKIETLLNISKILNLSTDDLLTKPLTINKIANFSEVEVLINQNEIQVFEPEEIFRDGSVKKLDLQKIFAKCKYLFEVDAQLAATSIYEKGTFLLLSLPNANIPENKSFLEFKKKKVNFISDFKSQENVYCIIGVLQTNENLNLIKSILNRIEILEAKVK